jgi:hypothetical protein
MFVAVFRRAHPAHDPLMSHTLSPWFSKIHFNIIFLYLCLPSGLFTSWSFHLIHPPYLSRPSNLPWFYYSSNICWRWQTVKFLSNLSSCYFLSSGSKFTPQPPLHGVECLHTCVNVSCIQGGETYEQGLLLNRHGFTYYQLCLNCFSYMTAIVHHWEVKWNWSMGHSIS